MRMRMLVCAGCAAGSLVYGSDDQGRTVHTDDAVMNAIMRQACVALNLRAHNVGPPANLTLLYGCCDIEGHAIVGYDA